MNSISIIPETPLLSVHLGHYQKAVDRTLEAFHEKKIISRIWEKDHTVWRPDPDEITNRLGWLESPASMMSEANRLEAFANQVREEGITHALLLGMGGSSLAPEVFRNTFGVKDGFLDLSILDTTDPDAILSRLQDLDLSRTLCIVSTKSGGTVETLSLFRYFYTEMVRDVGTEEAGKHFIAITDPKSKLTEMAETCRFQTVFLNDPNIGGRYSALSFFGLVPAALIGLNVLNLLERAQETASLCRSTALSGIGANTGAYLGVILGELALRGCDKATVILSSGIEGFGDWLEQLIAESTGKEGKGILPVMGESIEPPDHYGKDRFFVYIKLAGDDNRDDQVDALESAGIPVIRLLMKDPYDLGTQMFLWEMATAVAGHCLNINPFDQPDVESSKVLARKIIAEYENEDGFNQEAPSEMTADVLEQFLGRAEPHDYICIQAYIHPTQDTDSLLQKIRERIREKYATTITLGYGPRYLHSTGQIHKGDAGRGLFIQLTSDAIQDVSIPEEPGSKQSNITFGVLNMAQAMGDRQALLDGNRRIVRFHLGQDVVLNLRRFMELIP